MQCPKCRYEPTMAEAQRSPNDCVQCGVNYEGHARHVAAIAEQRAAEQKRNSEAPATHVKQAMFSNRGAQPVVVIDIHMSFGSMVIFMIKWVLAAIPAMLILFVLAAFAVGLFGALGR